MKRRVRVEFAGLIFASLLFVLLISLVEINNPAWFGSTASPDRHLVESAPVAAPVDAPEEPDCTAVESEFAEKLGESRSCRVDTDCSLASFECPFECVTSVSTSRLDDLKREEMSFQRTCHWCEASCPDRLSKWRAACVRQRCIVLDRSIEDLEEETLRLINEPG